MDILVLNGPNLNLLGVREPEIYGHMTFEDYFEELKEHFPDVNLTYFQSNSEGALIDKLHEVGFSYHGIAFNPGGYTHTSVALADAISGIVVPVVEVHISNIHARESFRTKSLTAASAYGLIGGLGLDGYRLAIDHLVATRAAD